MDRLNKAATTKISTLIDQYSLSLAMDIATSFELDNEMIIADVQELTRQFFTKHLADWKSHTCTWFTKRGEKCNKERKLGHDFCSVHSDQFLLHDEEINKAKTCPEIVNVTRRGISKNNNNLHQFSPKAIIA